MIVSKRWHMHTSVVLGWGLKESMIQTWKILTIAIMETQLSSLLYFGVDCLVFCALRVRSRPIFVYNLKLCYMVCTDLASVHSLLDIISNLKHCHSVAFDFLESS